MNAVARLADARVLARSLETVWQSLAGPRAALAFRIHERPADAALAGKLAELANRAPEIEALRPRTGRAASLEWAESRRCLAEVVEKLLPAEGRRPGATLAVSLAHTEGASIALGRQGPRGARAVAVGVDLERASRTVSSRAAARFVHASEGRFGLSPLEIWAVKEACFKADAGSAGTVVWNYEIRAFARARGRGRAGSRASARAAFDFGVLTRAGWVVALACAKAS